MRRPEPQRKVQNRHWHMLPNPGRRVLTLYLLQKWVGSGNSARTFLRMLTQDSFDMHS